MFYHITALCAHSRAVVKHIVLFGLSNCNPRAHAPQSLACTSTIAERFMTRMSYTSCCYNRTSDREGDLAVSSYLEQSSCSRTALAGLPDTSGGGFEQRSGARGLGAYLCSAGPASVIGRALFRSGESCERARRPSTIGSRCSNVSISPKDT